jgi:hypothetical protein
MGILDLDGGAFEYQWASDVAFDGIRLEVLTPEGGVLFDVSIPDAGPLTISTFSQDVPADLIVAAIAVARQRR